MDMDTDTDERDAEWEGEEDHSTLAEEEDADLATEEDSSVTALRPLLPEIAATMRRRLNSNRCRRISEAQPSPRISREDAEEWD
jgi:hypothetical protein